MSNSMNNDGENTYHFRVVTAGDSNVGKTCVIIRATRNTFSEFEVNTIGIDSFSLPVKDLEHPVVLDIIDTAGQERYGQLAATFFRNADVALIFYSIDDQKSLDNVNYWVNKVLDSVSSMDMQPIMYIIENKIDLRDDKKLSLLSTEEGKNKARELNIKFERVSAKTGENVNNLFLNIGRDCLSRPIGKKQPEVEINDEKSGCKC